MACATRLCERPPPRPQSPSTTKAVSADIARAAVAEATGNDAKPWITARRWGHKRDNRSSFPHRQGAAVTAIDAGRPRPLVMTAPRDRRLSPRTGLVIGLSREGLAGTAVTAGPRRLMG